MPLKSPIKTSFPEGLVLNLGNSVVSLKLMKTNVKFFALWKGETVKVMKPIVTKPAPIGFRWVFCRFRRVRGNSGKKLDAWAYGYKAWAFLARA